MPLLARAGYALLSQALAPALLGWLWWRGRREPGYRQKLAERLGFIQADPDHFACIWLHAASVGEVQAARPLIESLLREWPQHVLVVSTQTPTGAAALRATWGEQIRHVYAPLDTPGATSRFLDRLQPRLLILMERELWPGWLQQCQKRQIPVALVNARLTQKSFLTYQRWQALMGEAWSALTVAAADTATAERYAQLGVPAGQISQTGNLKFDVMPPQTLTVLSQDLASRTLIVAGSTHEADESAWLDAWARLAPQHPECLLVLVPRHPQRFDTVAQALKTRGLPFLRTSARTRSAQVATDQTQVLLVDQMGELMFWYSHAALCFVGGTLARVGGHNPLEPLVAGKPILFGPHTHNAPQVFDEIEQTGAGLRVHDTDDLVRATEAWLTQPESLQASVQAAKALLLRNQGASKRTLEVLRTMRALGESSSKIKTR